MLVLARWGMKWAMGERREGEAFHGGWAVLGLRACFDPETAQGVSAMYEFRVGDEVFHALVQDGTIDTQHGPAQRPDAVIETDDEVLVDMAAGRTTFAEAVKERRAEASGDPAALGALYGIFRIPAPEERGIPGVG